MALEEMYVNEIALTLHYVICSLYRVVEDHIASSLLLIMVYMCVYLNECVSVCLIYIFMVHVSVLLITYPDILYNLDI